MNRRHFIQHTALATMAVSSFPLFSTSNVAAKALHKKSLKFGMVKEDIPLVEKFNLLLELGFDGVELNSPNELMEKEILEARDATGIIIPGVVNSIHWKSPLSDPDPAVRKICTDSMIDALHKCKLYGGSTVLLVPAVVNKDVSYADAWDRSVEEIKKILPEAHKTGIKVALENVWNNFLLSPLEAAHYVDQFDSDHIGWYMDVGNVVRYGWPEQWIRTLGKRILKVDVKEYSRKKQQEEGIWKGFDVKIGDGDCDWAAVNKALAGVGYSGWGSAEVPGGDRTRLEEISHRMDEIYSL